MNSSTTLQLVSAVVVTVLSIALLWANTKLKEPVMETGTAKGKMVLGKWDHESNSANQVMCTELKEPVMETGRDTGKLVLGKKDYKV